MQQHLDLVHQAADARAVATRGHEVVHVMTHDGVRRLCRTVDGTGKAQQPCTLDECCYGQVVGREMRTHEFAEGAGVLLGECGLGKWREPQMIEARRQVHRLRDTPGA